MTKTLGTVLMIIGALASIGAALFGILNMSGTSAAYGHAATVLLFVTMATFLPGLLIRDINRPGRRP